MSKRKIDKGTLAGVLLAIVAVLGGLMLDGGSVRQIIQPTAALIVLLGTLAALLIQFPLRIVRAASQELFEMMTAAEPHPDTWLDHLVGICGQMRRYGILTLDAKLNTIEDEFLRKGLTLAVDGVGSLEMRDAMEADLVRHEEQEEELVRVLEAAGGFAPTLGIVGAVLGLIQVMQRMDNVGEIGKGIAVAFVSTLYGIGSANLCFLPLAGRLRIRMRQRQILREMTLEAILLMLQGITAGGLRERLRSHQRDLVTVEQDQPQPELASR